MDPQKVVGELLDVLKPLALTDKSRAALLAYIKASGLRVDDDLRPLPPVVDTNLERFLKTLDGRPVWRIAAKSVLRKVPRRG